MTDFSGQTDNWTAYAFSATTVALARPALFCVAAVPTCAGSRIGVAVRDQVALVRPALVGRRAAGYVGETGGPLPADKAVYLSIPAVGTCAFTTRQVT